MGANATIISLFTKYDQRNHIVHATHRSARDISHFVSKSCNDEKRNFSPNMRINHSVHATRSSFWDKPRDLVHRHLGNTAGLPVFVFALHTVFDLGLRPESGMYARANAVWRFLGLGKKVFFTYTWRDLIRQRNFGLLTGLPGKLKSRRN